MPEQKNCKSIFLTAAANFLSVLLYWSQNQILNRHHSNRNHTNKPNRQDFLKYHHKVVDKIATFICFFRMSQTHCATAVTAIQQPDKRGFL